MKYYDKLIFDLSKAGRQGYSLPANKWETSVSELPAGLLRAETPALPEVSELDVVRHYTNISTVQNDMILRYTAFSIKIHPHLRYTVVCDLDIIRRLRKLISRQRICLRQR